MSKSHEALKLLCLIPALCTAVSACSGAGDSTSGAGDTGAAVAEKGSAVAVHEESLIDGAQLTVMDVDGQPAIRVILPSTASDALAARVKASAEATDFASRYAAWTGGKALSSKLQTFAEAEKLALSAPVSDLADLQHEGKALEDVSQVAVGRLEGKVGVRDGVGQAQQAAVDWNQDATNFLNASCVKTTKQYSLIYQPNLASAWVGVAARYHRMAQKAADGDSLYKVTVDGVLKYSDILPSGYILNWDQGSVEARRDIKLEGRGLGPNPRLHQCMLWGWEKFSSHKVSITQFGDLHIEGKGIDFHPARNVNLYFVHPTRGNIDLTGGTGANALADGSVTVKTGLSGFGCESLHITRESKYRTSTLLLLASDGRQATTTTSLLQDKCWSVLPAN
jgi:hypothetical protein